MTSDDRSESITLARRMADLARERRGTDVVLLDVRALVDYADAFLLVTGQSSRQNLAVAEHIVRVMKGEKHYAISKSGLDSGSWICLDLGDVVVHVFDPETRARYDLELLWADAPRVDVGPGPGVTSDPAVKDAPAADDPSAPVAAVDDAGAPPKRRRAVRKAAVEEADAANAPDAERPADGEVEADDGSSPDEDAVESDEPAPKRKKALKKKAKEAKTAAARKVVAKMSAAKSAPRSASKGPTPKPAPKRPTTKGPGARPGPTDAPKKRR